MMSTAPGLDWLPTTLTSIVDAGSLYIEHGLRVVIVHGIKDDGSCTCGKPAGACKPGKHPVLGAWQKKVYETVTEFRDALADKRIPDPQNLGIVLGVQLNGDYLIAVDNDNAARMADLEAAIGALPDTLTTRSGSGGSHRLYALGEGQDPKRMKNRTGVRLDTEDPTTGVDVKVTGGQIVVCPSLHVSGDRYSWAIAAPIAPLPRAWFDLIAEPLEVAKPRASGPTNVIHFGDRYLEQVIENNCKDMAGRGKGERNSVLFSKVCTVLEHCAGAGRSFSVALPRLRDAGIACGLPKHEVDDVLRKAERQVRSTGKTRVPSSPMPTGSRPSSPPPSTPGEVIDIESRAWAEELVRSQQGNVKNTLRNVALILRQDDFFRGRLSYNRMRIVPYVDGQPLRDSDLARFREEMEKRWGVAPGSETMADAVVLVADERSFHPLQDYLGGLVWDGEGRISRVASEVLGIAVPDALTQRMLRCWFISAVARAMRPGCKVDTTLVLVGLQSFRKSTFFATLGGEWFSNTYVDIRNKDGILQIHAAWLHEWAEIERVTVKTSSSDVKAFLTSAKDSVRPPFGRGVLIQPRSSVIVGTTNKAFLDDETGSRRFWPVRVNQLVDVAQLSVWRDQLWAEAVAAFNAAEEWWLTAEEDVEREVAADDHMVENPWLERVSTFLKDPSRQQYGVTVADVTTGLGIDIGRVTHGDTIRAGKAMRRLGWWSRQETRGEARVRIHYPRSAQSQSGCSVHNRSTDESVITTQEQSAQSTHSNSIHVRDRDAGVDVGAHEHTRDHEQARGGNLKSTPANRAIPCSQSEVADMTAGVRRAKVDTVQDEEPGLSDWLSEQGIETPKRD